MLTKWWELCCDFCGSAINHYMGNKLSYKELIDDGVYINGFKHYCNKECYLKDKAKSNKLCQDLK